MNVLASSVGQGAYQPIDGWGAIFRLIVALAIVLPLAYLAARLYSKQAGGGKSRALNVLDARVLGPNRGIYLVEAGERLLLLGVTSHQITLLAEFTDPDQIERLKESANGGNAAPFSEFLGNAIKKSRRGETEGERR